MVNTLALRRAVGMALCAMMLVATTVGAGALPAAAQEDPTATPGLDLNLDQNAGTAQNQQSGESTTVTPTPVVGSASGPGQVNPTPAQQQTQASAQQSQPTAQQAGGATDVPVLAQGLIYLDGGDVIWQAREVELSGSDTTTGNARIYLQRTGESIIRNDLTGKRTRLEVGEAYFAAAGDPYTTFAAGSGSSVVWVFEISNSNQVGDGAFYLSPNVTAYGEAVYDYELSRNVVAAGETAQFPGGDGPSLLVVLSGAVTVTAGAGPAELAEKDGLVVDGSATVTGPESGEAAYLTLTVGPKVSDESAAPPAPASAADTASDTTAGQTQTTASSDTSDTTSQAAETPAASAAPAEQSADTGEFVTSVQVGAKEGVGVTMYADGVLVFDGWLEPGEWTEFYTGSNFEVYTTSGENTLFKNSCGGDPFLMGYETGDAHYFLAAGPQSCAPAG